MLRKFSKCLAYSFISLLFLIVIISCGSSSNGIAPQAAGGEDFNWTILIYMEGTDLEENDALATNNIKEMLAATPSDKVAIVLTTGAANKAVSGDPVTSFRTMKRHVIQNGTIQEVQDLGNLDMGNAARLTDFIVWAHSNYPADHYLLVFWDHGGGALNGFGSYLTNPQLTPMSIIDLRKGIADAVAITGKTFDIIGFDACLMATIETAYALKDYANYLAASEDLEPGNGWAYTDLINYIVANPNAGGTAIGKALADSYHAKMIKDSTDAAITFSITDLSKIQAVATTLSAFAVWQENLLNTGGDTAWTDLAYSRSRSLDFYTASLTTRYTDMVDAINMINREWFKSQQTTDLMNAINNAVVYKVAGRLRSDAHGLSLMFPTGNLWDPDVIDFYKSLPFVSAYQNLVEKYSTYARNNIPDKIISDPVLTSSKMTSGITPADAFYEQAYVCMIMNSGSVTRVYGQQPIWAETPGVLEFTWDGSWYTLNDVIVSVLAEPRLETEDTVTLRIPMAVGEDTGLYYLRYNYTKDTLELLGFVKNESGQLTNQPYKGFVQLQPGDVITPLVYKLSNSNWLQNAWEKGTAKFTVPSGGIVFDKTSLASGTYNVSFMVEDLRLKPSFSSYKPFTK